MIMQKFLYDNQEILCLYHTGFDDYPVSRKVYKTLYIRDTKVELIEELFTEDVSGIMYDEIVEGFLECKNSKNPYNNYSTYFKEFINFKKVFYQDDKLLLDLEVFNEICNFVKEYSNFDLKDNPYSIGNKIIYYPERIDVKMSLDKEKPENIKININNLHENHTIIVKLKFNNFIVDVKILKSETDYIETNTNWNSLDLEVYDKNKLVYSDKDIYFIKSINTNINIINKIMLMDLHTEKKQIKMQSISSEPITRNHHNEDFLIDYFHKETQVRNQLKGKDNGKVIFLTKNQRAKAFSIFEEIAKSTGYDELWIFDPYFINYNVTGGKEKLRDIIKILACNHSLKKIIVYEDNKQKTDNQGAVIDVFGEFWSEIIDEDIKVYMNQFNNLNFKFCAVSEHFHDRFIFLKGSNKIKGFILGTSLNSFGENYSTITNLEIEDAKNIFQKLIDEVINNNIVIEKVL